MLASIDCEVREDMDIVIESSLNIAFVILLPKFSPVIVIVEPVVTFSGEKDIIRGVACVGLSGFSFLLQATAIKHMKAIKSRCNIEIFFQITWYRWHFISL